MSFKQEGTISTLKGKLQKLVVQFTNLGSNISSTESYVNIRIGKAWSAIDRLSIRWKSDPFDKIKPEFIRVAMSILLYGGNSETLMKSGEKKI